MSRLVGWVVISRDSQSDGAMTVVTAMDKKIAATEEAALTIAKTKLPEKVFRVTAFGVMAVEMETKLNLAKALRELGFMDINLNQVYDGIVNLLERSARTVSH